jgi:tetratricopeptide (TPR) repeat protein
MKVAGLKVFSFSFFILPFAFLALGGCVAYQAAGEVERGRPELIFGDPKIALGSFQRAAELQPGFRYNFSLLSEGIWSYVGRAHYHVGNLAEARKALETDLSRHSDDNLARLYLGMVLARDGSRERGLKEMESALSSLHDWLDDIEQYHPEGIWWDPGKELRAEIRRQLQTIGGREFQLADLISSAEYLGKKFEEEIDWVRRYKYGGDDDGESADSSIP